MEKPTKSVDGQEPTLAPAPAKSRAKWQPLGYEKLDAAQAQTTAPNFGADGSSYS